MANISAAEWSSIVNQVRVAYPNLTRNWFDQLQAISIKHGVLEVVCANLPQQRYLGQHCSRAFCTAAQQQTGRLVSIQFVVAHQENKDHATNQPQEVSSHDIFEDTSEQIALNPEYTFEQFVTGPCNRLAHASCVAVSHAPGEAYNPLFIHGEAGLGKTHLLQAICQNLDHKQHLRTLYLSCETFNNHFISAVEHAALHQFRFRYRHVDILLIDDIQFLAGRERTQEELFHTFNTLYQSRKQIVLSADCPPRDIPDLEERLISRFNWGLVTRIDRPCLETREAIVRTKARNRKLKLPADVVHHIAAAIDTNTRELEGAITSVDAYTQQLGSAIDLPAAQAALGGKPTITPTPVSIPQIVTAVSEYFGVSKSDLRGKRRSKSIVYPRQMCMQLARTLTLHSLEEIGNHFGGRDHTTVMHATRRIAKLEDQDQQVAQTLRMLRSQLGAPPDAGVATPAHQQAKHGA